MTVLRRRHERRGPLHGRPGGDTAHGGRAAVCHGGPPLERSREWGTVLCREPTEYPESYKGITLCPVCEWREAQRTACSR
ncbi:hypothetical protein [Streptomyces sp. NPDC054783]